MQTWANTRPLNCNLIEVQEIHFEFSNFLELSSQQSETGGGNHEYAAINYTHHFKQSRAVVNGIYLLWSLLSSIIFRHHLNLSETAMYSCVVAAADFLTTELNWSVKYC